MAITFIGSTSGNAASGANITLTLSGVAGIATGDLVYITSGTFNRSGNEGRIGNALGFTADRDVTNTIRLRTAYKIYNSGTDGSCVVEGSAATQDAMSAVALVFRGVQSASVLDVTSVTATGSSTNPNPPAIVPPDANCCIVVGAVNGGTIDAAVGTITNYLPATHVQNQVTDNNPSTTAMAYRILSGGAGASEDPAAFSAWTTGAWVSFSAALRPTGVNLTVAANFAGAGALVATPRVNRLVNATFAGAGALVASLSVAAGATNHLITAAFAGSGRLQANLTTPVQLLRPDADNTDGGWTNELDGSVLSPSIDEASPDDDDFIKSSIDPVADICRFRLSNPTNIATAPMKVRARYKRTGVGPIDLTMRLQQGASDIAEWVYSDIADTFLTVEETLTAPQFAAITDFADMFVEFQADVASAAVTIDVNPGTSQRSGSAVTSYTYTGLTTTPAANCIVVLMNVQLRGTSVTSVVWDSAGANQAFTSLGITQEGAGSGASHLEVWALMNPASSGNKNINVAWSGGSCQIMMAAISLIGAASFTPTSGTISSSASPSFNVSSAVGHIALGLIANRGTNFSAPTGGTQIFLDNNGAGSNGAAQWGVGAATVSFGWTNDTTDFYGWFGVDVSP